MRTKLHEAIEAAKKPQITREKIYNAAGKVMQIFAELDYATDGKSVLVDGAALLIREHSKDKSKSLRIVLQSRVGSDLTATVQVSLDPIPFICLIGAGESQISTDEATNEGALRALERCLEYTDDAR